MMLRYFGGGVGHSTSSEGPGVSGMHDEDWENDERLTEEEGQGEAEEEGLDSSETEEGRDTDTEDEPGPDYGEGSDLEGQELDSDIDDTASMEFEDAEDEEDWD
jgi:hypothetical protein